MAIRKQLLVRNWLYLLSTLFSLLFHCCAYRIPTSLISLCCPHPTSSDFWDTAGQEAFNRMHPSYYYRAHCCILVFDVTRKVTYQHLSDWYKELREHCENIPCVLVANKIDVDYNVCWRLSCPYLLISPLYHPCITLINFLTLNQVTRKEFKFAAKHKLPFFFVSAADGTNIVKVVVTSVLHRNLDAITHTLIHYTLYRS